VTRAPVLGGGGVTGIAWETGLLLGLRDEGIDLVGADVTIGSSAGAAVGAQILSGTDLGELYERQLDPVHHEIAAELDLKLVLTIFRELAKGPPTQDVLARIGEKALAAPTVPESERRAVIEHRLPSHDWPTAVLRLTAIDAATGELVVFDRSSGVSLVDAVAASCAVPGVWPPVTIGERRFIDGGVKSPTNADLAAGHDEVIVLAPLAGPTADWADVELAELEAAGVRTLLIVADDEATAAMGPNALDPAMRRPAAEAGRRQARAAATRF
jgi:NTE family protein